MQSPIIEKKEVPSWVTGTLETPAGFVYRVATEWIRADYWGMIKSRTSAFRMNYSVSTGLYAVENPTGDSDVFVTANYKLTFDLLRRALKGLSAWVLVLDTKSINVWCAAGKGTFGTDELIKRIGEAKLDTLITHRRIILPQLGAVGVNAKIIQKRTGYRVLFGPVQARDIPAYVRAGYKKNREMSTIRFPIFDRLMLTPMELNPAFRNYFPWLAAGIFFVFGLQSTGVLFRDAWSGGLPFFLLSINSIIAGALLTPLLLPYIPFRSFAIKGWIVGAMLLFIVMQCCELTKVQDPLLLTVAYLLFPAMSSYIALQFTGATTYTSISGVKKELKFCLPVYIGVACITLILMVLFKLKEWSIL